MVRTNAKQRGAFGMDGALQRYIQTAKRLWLLVALTVALIAVPGLFAAYDVSTTTFESDATVWVERAGQQYQTGEADDPNQFVFGRMSPGAEQAELFSQLVQTNSFIIEVIGQTSLQPAYEAAAEKDRFRGEVRSRFRGQALGTNLVRLSYQAREPGIAAEMVTAALAAREGRVKNARLAATTTATAFYQREFEIAQRQALVAQTALEEFTRSRATPLPANLEYQQNQLRLAVDVAQVRLNDLRTRLDRGTVSTALLDMAESVQFQVIDRPQADPFPTGGTRGASLIAAVALVGALALATCLVVVATVLDDRIRDLVGLSRFRDVEVFGVVEKATGTARDATAQTLFDPSNEPSAMRRRTA